MRLHKTFHKIMHHNLTKKSPKFQSFNDDEFSKNCTGIVEKILKGSLDLIPSPSVKIQIMDGKVCLRCKGKTMTVTRSKIENQKMINRTSHKVSLYFHFQLMMIVS